MQLQDGDRLLKRPAVAQMLGLQPQTLARWAMEGKHLPVVRLGRTVRYRERDVWKLMGLVESTATA